MIHLQLEGQRGLQTLQIDLTLRQPWTVLFGVSGTGKSSILRALCGLWKPARCRLQMDHVTLDAQPPHRRRIALVAQTPSLFPHQTACKNVQFSLPHGEEADALQLLERFHVAHTAQRKPHTLSGGEQQRVALARALASSPKLLLLDESFSGTDLGLRAELIATLKQMQRERGFQILSVTHDVPEALQSADEVALLQGGRIVLQDTPAAALHQQRSELQRIVRD